MSNNIQSSGLADRLRKFSINYFIEAPANQAYPMTRYVPTDFVIESVHAQSSAGSCTIAISINGSTVTFDGALGVTTSPIARNATALNSGSEGDRIVMTVSSVSSAADLEVTLVGRYE